MTINNSVSWRCRNGGSNSNGGGYDPAIAGTLSTTLNGSVSSGATSITVASASGWPSSGNYYARIGNTQGELFSSGNTGSSEVVLVTAGQGTTTWTVTRAQLGTVAQAFATGVVVDNELSRCDTAVASGSGATSTASTTIFGLSGANSTWIGNTLLLASATGTPTVAPYFVQSITNGTTIVVDRASGTYTAGAWKVGGAWGSDAHGQISSTWILPGHLIFIRATGGGSIGSPDQTWSTYVSINGDTTNGPIRFIGENGRPFWSASSGGFIFASNTLYFYNLYAFPTGGGSGVEMWESCSVVVTDSCVLDQNGIDSILAGQGFTVGCELLSSTSFSGSNSAIPVASNPTCLVIGCNIHDVGAGGLNPFSIGLVMNCIIAKCKSYGMQIVDGTNNDQQVNIVNNTVDNNGGDAIQIATDYSCCQLNITGNLITNHTAGSTFGLNCAFGSTAANDAVRGTIDWNTYYGNTTNASNITVGTATVNGTPLHDNIGINPQYTAISSENYLPTNPALAGLGFPNTFLQSKGGNVASVSKWYPGAVQRAS